MKALKNNADRDIFFELIPEYISNQGYLVDISDEGSFSQNEA